MHYTETEKLLTCIKKGVSPYHTVQQAGEQLEAAGFTRLVMAGPWELKAGGNYYMDVYGSTLFAFHLPENYKPGMPLRAAVGHTDWPGPRIKTLPEITEGRYEKLNIEIYGGPIFYSWLDRPLSIAGAVGVYDEVSGKPVKKLVDFRRPMAVIPSLAIHYNREVNEKMQFNAQKHLLPLMDVIEDGKEHDGYFYRLLAEEVGVKPEDILSIDLGLYNLDEPVLYGEHTEMLSAPRLDNLTSVQGCVSGMIGAAEANSKAFSAIMIFDNEEIGSNTKQGADSLLMAELLEKITLTMGGTHLDYVDSTMGGILLSCDVSHAMHPNYPEMNDPTNRVYPGDGVAFKRSSRQNYATDIYAQAIAKAICRKNNIPHKSFCNRADVRGGGTLGSMLSAQLCIRTMDLGVSILSMHSARELMATKDQKALSDFIAEILKNHESIL